jgi:hypothetical protein
MADGRRGGFALYFIKSASFFALSFVKNNKVFALSFMILYLCAQIKTC